jgi:hypothetical protein
MLQGPFVKDSLRASYERLGTMLVKVAMILATFDAEKLPVTVEAQHVYRAQQIVEEWRVNLHDVFGHLEPMVKDSLQEQVKNVLARAGKEWTSTRELQRKLPKGTKMKDVRPVLDDLLTDGEIETKTIKNEGAADSEGYRLLM